MLKILGYPDRFSVRPGETIRFMVSSALSDPYRADFVRIVHGDVNPDGPGYHSWSSTRSGSLVHDGIAACRVIAQCAAAAAVSASIVLFPVRAGASSKSTARVSQSATNRTYSSSRTPRKVRTNMDGLDTAQLYQI